MYFSFEDYSNKNIPFERNLDIDRSGCDDYHFETQPALCNTLPVSTSELLITKSNEILNKSQIIDFTLKIPSYEYMTKISTSNLNENNSDYISQIPWNDMFDVNMFADLQHNKSLETEKNNCPPTDENLIECNAIRLADNVEKDVRKIPKRKNVEITKIVGNKVNKCKENAVNYRKEKYTKTVKKWLNEANTNFELNEIDSNQIINNKLFKPVSEVTKDKKTKKTVQSRLANKGGVMKFAKPQQSKTTKNEVTCDMGKEQTKENKEKKGKSKFVAPFKTPLPVKDTTFVVNKITKANLHEFKNIFEIDSKDVVVTLIYRYVNR